jgi:hypothetical protein
MGAATIPPMISHRQLPGGGQAGARRLPAAGDGLHDPVPNLLVDRHRAVGLDAEQHDDSWVISA